MFILKKIFSIECLSFTLALRERVFHSLKSLQNLSKSNENLKKNVRIGQECGQKNHAKRGIPVPLSPWKSDAPSIRPLWLHIHHLPQSQQFGELAQPMTKLPFDMVMASIWLSWLRFRRCGRQERGGLSIEFDFFALARIGSTGRIDSTSRTVRKVSHCKSSTLRTLP